MLVVELDFITYIKSIRYLSEQLELKRKFCSDHHESKMVGKKQITDLSEF